MNNFTTKQTEVIEFVNYEIQTEKNCLNLIDQITSEIVEKRERYKNDTYSILLMKTEQGSLSEETVSTAITKLDPDYIGCKDNMDDSYRDAIYRYGIKLVREYSAMGFPMQISYSDETKLEDYIGPIGVVMIIPDEDGITIIFQSITECSVLSDFTIANKIIFGTNGRAYRLDITNLYVIPEWVKRITVAISNFTHWS